MRHANSTYETLQRTPANVAVTAAPSWLVFPLSFLLLAAAALAQPPGSSVLQGFEPTQDYVLIIEGEQDETAEIYVSQRLPAFLAMSEALPSPFLLVPRTQEVQALHIMKVAKQSDGTVDLLPDAILRSEGRFSIVETDLHFTVGGKDVVFTEKPPLLGVHDVEGMRAYSVEYARLADAYSPSSEALKALAGKSGDIDVRVYFGTWCPFCQRYVPRIMRVAEELSDSAISFDFYGLPRSISSDPVSAEMDIKAVPTGVVFVEGREAGRIQSDQWRAPEVALSQILSR